MVGYLDKINALELFKKLNVLNVFIVHFIYNFIKRLQITLKKGYNINLSHNRQKIKWNIKLKNIFSLYSFFYFSPVTDCNLSRTGVTLRYGNVLQTFDIIMKLANHYELLPAIICSDFRFSSSFSSTKFSLCFYSRKTSESNKYYIKMAQKGNVAVNFFKSIYHNEFQW